MLIAFSEIIITRSSGDQGVWKLACPAKIISISHPPFFIRIGPVVPYPGGGGVSRFCALFQFFALEVKFKVQSPITIVCSQTKLICHLISLLQGHTVGLCNHLISQFSTIFIMNYQSYTQVTIACNTVESPILQFSLLVYYSPE